MDFHRPIAPAFLLGLELFVLLPLLLYVGNNDEFEHGFSSYLLHGVPVALLLATALTATAYILPGALKRYFLALLGGV